ncbi:MAG: phosphatidylglycerol:prolipoprotein diacylglycerol transferase [Hyphomicrobiaceae bacterium]|jgi:phosphatidylglycerol:prolipoprotein diacylglycerol transferase
MYPVIFEYGRFAIYSFGVFMALGFYFGATVAVAEFERRGGEGEKMWNFLVWVFVIGLISSRVLSVFNDPAAFFAAPLTQLLAGAGFVWYGGLIGGAGAAWLLSKRYGLNFPLVAECCSLGLALGHAFGRIGCHVAGDGDWGQVTELPWGVAYTNAIVGWPHDPGVLVHPAPLYEAASYFTIFAILWYWRRTEPPLGSMLGFYLVFSSLARFLVEFLRIEPVIALGLTQAQYVAIVLFVVGALLFARSRSTSELAGAGA